MATNKTAPTDGDPRAFIAGLDSDRRRREALELLELFEARTGEQPVMWGDSIVGFGSYDYSYQSGRTGTWMRVGFSPRKSQLTVYVMPGFDRYEAALQRLGPHSTGQSCLYLKRLEAVDIDVLGDIIADSYETMGQGDS